MRVCDARTLKRGDSVVWEDPDDGLCTRGMTIAKVTVVGDTVYLRCRDTGDELECFAEELHFVR